MKLLAQALCCFVLLEGVGACSLDFDQFGAASKGHERDAGRDADGGVRLGDPCRDDGARTCDGHASRHTLVCRDEQWRAGSECGEDERCDSRAGDAEGTCVRIPTECADRSAGESFCADDVLRQCDVDLISFVDVACGAFGACDEAGGGAQCRCDDGHPRAANGGCGDVAVDAGADGGDDGTNGGAGDKAPKNKPPRVEVIFPPPGVTDRSSITVRGTVSDPEGDDVTRLTVNGKAAKLKSDGSFSVSAKLAIGSHPLAFHVEDERGAKADIDGNTIERMEYLFDAAADMVLDSKNKRVIALDRTTDAIVAISTDDGTRTLIVPPSDTPVGRNSLELDAARHRVLVTEVAVKALAWLDLKTGERTAILDAVGPGTAIEPHAAVLDSPTHAYVTAAGNDDGYNSDVVYSVDLTTGDHTKLTLSGTNIQNFGKGNDIAYDAARGQLLVLAYDGLLAVDPNTGAAHFIATGINRGPKAGHGVSLFNPRRLAVDGDRAVIYGGEYEGNGPICIDSVDLTDGTVHELAALTLGKDPRPPSPFETNNPFAFDPDSGDAYVLDVKGQLLRVRLQPGDREFVSDAVYGTGPFFDRPISITEDPTRQRWIVADDELGALVTVDKNSGDRSILSDASGAAPAFDTLVAVAVDTVNDDVIALDNQTLFRVDPLTGERTVIASDISGSVVGSGPSFAGAVDMVVENAKAFVVGCYGPYPCSGQLISIALADGTRTIVSANGTGNGPLGQFSALAIAPSGYLVTTHDLLSGDSTLLSVNRTSGERTLIADNTTGAGIDLKRVEGLAYDAKEDRAILVNEPENMPEQLLAVDLISGDRTLVTDENDDVGPFTSFFSDLIADTATHRLVIAEGWGGNDAGLLGVLLADRKRTLIGDQSPGLWVGTSTLLDRDHGTLYAGDAPLETNGKQGASLTALDVRTGERTLISDDSNNGGTVRWTAPAGLALDAKHGRLLGVNHPFLSPNALVAVDLDDGTQSVLSDTSTGTGVAWNAPFDLAWDAAHDRTLLACYGLPGIVAVDKNGDRTLFSGGATGDGVTLQKPATAALDTDANRLLVVDTKQIIAIDLESGNRELFAAPADDKGDDLVAPGHIVIDPIGARAILLDTGDVTIGPALISIALDDGTRSTLATLPRSWYTGSSLALPAMAFDGVTEIAYVGLLYALDTTTGEYILLAGYGK